MGNTGTKAKDGVNRGRSMQGAANLMHKLAAGRTSLKLGKLGLAGSALASPFQVGTLMDGKASSSDKWSAASGLMSTARSGLDVANQYNIRKAASSAIRGSLGAGAPKSVINASARTAADHALKAAPQAAAKSNPLAYKAFQRGAFAPASNAATKPVAGAVGKTLSDASIKSGSVGKTARHAIGKSARAAASKSGAAAALKASRGTLGKAAGRFIPGMNVAIAAMDAKAAYDAWHDDSVGGAKKGLKIATALGSALGATNIPLVSQIGSGISVATSLLSSWF